MQANHKHTRTHTHILLQFFYVFFFFFVTCHHHENYHFHKCLFFFSFFCLFLLFSRNDCRSIFIASAMNISLLLVLSKMVIASFERTSLEFLHLTLQIQVYIYYLTRKHQTSVSQLNIHIKLMTFEEG